MQTWGFIVLALTIMLQCVYTETTQKNIFSVCHLQRPETICWSYCVRCLKNTYYDFIAVDEISIYKLEFQVSLKVTKRVSVSVKTLGLELSVSRKRRNLLCGIKLMKCIAARSYCLVSSNVSFRYF